MPSRFVTPSTVLAERVPGQNPMHGAQAQHFATVLPENGRAGKSSACGVLQPIHR